MIVKVVEISVGALVAIALISVVTGGVTVVGQVPENNQKLNATEIDESTPIEEERTSSASTGEYEAGFVQPTESP